VPPVIAGIVAIISAIGSAAAGAFAAIGISVSAGTALSILTLGASLIIGGIRGLLANRPSSTSSLVLDKGSNSVAVRQSAAPRVVAYGRNMMGGIVTYIAAVGTDAARLHIVVTVAGHQVEAIDAVLFDTYQLVLDGSGNETGKYSGLCYVEFKLGAPGEPAFPRLITDTATLPADSQWTSAHRQDGCASVHICLTWNENAFANGVPAFRFLVRGKNDCYDPRTGTKSYTSNLAVCLRDYLVETKYGMRAPVAEINDAAFIVAANLADEDVDLAAGGTEPRYACNGYFDTSKTMGDIIQGLLSAGAGKLSWISGQWSLVLGSWRPPAFALTDDDLRGAVQLTGLFSRRDLYNGVKGIFISPTNNWQSTDFPPMVRASFVAYDSGFNGTAEKGYWLTATDYAVNDAVMSVGYAYVCITAHTSSPDSQPGVGASWETYWIYAGDINWKDVEYPFTTSPATAQRLAKQDLEAGRRQIQLALAVKLQGYLAVPPDVIEITRETFAWDHKTFELQQASLVADSGSAGSDAPVLGVDMTLRETDSGVYDWTTADEQPMASSGTPTLPGDSVIDPGYFQVETGPYWAGGSDARALLLWTEDSSYVTGGGSFLVSYKLHTDSAWTDVAPLAGSATSLFLDLTDGSAYDFRIQAQTVNGLLSDVQEIDNFAVSITTARFARPTYSARTIGSNNSAITAGDPLSATDDGGDHQGIISIPAWTMEYGSGLVNYNSHAIPHLAANFYYVYCDDPTLTGGDVTYHATGNLADFVGDDTKVYRGSVTVDPGIGGPP
jgi:hypothetical protein